MMTLRLREIALTLAEDESQLPDKIADLLVCPRSAIRNWKVVRRGIDARKKPHVLRIYTVDFEVDGAQQLLTRHKENPRLVPVPEAEQPVSYRLNRKPQVVVVGMGPAGLFAALRLVESGANVTLIERGKPVDERYRDVLDFQQNRRFDPESNIQFGEGGAGTFSDGKLNSRLNHPLMRQVLETLVKFGAPEAILCQAKPHVGSDRLRALLLRFRQHLQSLGVEIRFSSRLCGIEFSNNRCVAACLQHGELLPAEHLVLALGHSARDTYQMLSQADVAMEQKAFAIGLRVEHPLELINSIQYGMASHPQLPAAEYSLAWNNKKSGRGVYSFCMCPGGQVVNAASEEGGIVVNGMSDYRRDAELSNSALVVAVRPDDFSGADPLAGVRFQRQLEQRAFALAGGDWSAPAQPLLEFLHGKGGRLYSSCRPQVVHSELEECLPDFVTTELRQALPHFERRMRGFICREATLIGVETRTSAPLRILRNAEGESISHAGMFPAGEGAGYAGGIMSAAVDGLKAADSILKRYSD